MSVLGTLPKPPVPKPEVPIPSSSPSPAGEALSALIESTYTTCEIQFWVNGQRTVVANPDPDWMLLDWIRAQDRLKGTKLGCGEGGCGACTVVIQYPEKGKRVRHNAVNACLFPLVGIDGKSLITIEGLGSVTHPHPLQERIAKMHGSQCGFCTPGIVMSLYALIRNSYRDGVFHLTCSDIELQGHLDGNLCRCTGYKPILEAARTFIVEDLRGTLVEDPKKTPSEGEPLLQTYAKDQECGSDGIGSCGRPGGCCRDQPSPSSGNTSVRTSSQESVATPATSAASTDNSSSSSSFLPYDPTTEIIFPPALWRFEPRPLCYGDERKLWFKPTTLGQLLELKDAWPAAKVVGGASETQVEVRFKKSVYQISIYTADIEELNSYTLPHSDIEIQELTEVPFPGNLSLTKVEEICRTMTVKLGARAMPLTALGKQLRYFAGRQIRNTASLAGNLATASPISDAAPALWAAGATITMCSKKQGSWDLPLSKFFVKYRTTQLPADGVITHIRVPLASPNEVTKAYKQSKRKDDDIAIVTAGFRVRLDSEGTVSDASFAFGGMAPTTVSAAKTQDAVVGQMWADRSTLEAALDALSNDFDLPVGVVGGMAHYRKALALSMFFRFWNEALADLGVTGAGVDLSAEIHRGLSSGTRDHFPRAGTQVVGREIPHLSALKHCTGEAQYVDDMTASHNELFGALVLSKEAHAKILAIDWRPALELPGVVGYIDHTSIPDNSNSWGPIRADEPLFAKDKVVSHGQTIGMVYAQSALSAQAAATQVRVSYARLPAILTISEAIAAGSFFEHGKELRKGAAAVDASSLDGVFGACAHVVAGTTKLGGQEHFYLETNAARAVPHGEDGSVEVYASSQNLMENQVFVARVLGVPMNRVNMRVRRLGGAYGGKESRSTPFACLVAIAAQKERRPVRLVLNRDDDIVTTGQRHPMQCRWKVGVSADGRIQALEADLYNNAGYSLDMSGAVMDRACTHLDNCYAVPHARIRGWVCRTNTVTNTAFRGFGGPQAMYFCETMMSAIAETLSIDVDELRARNLYHEGDLTPFLQKIDVDFHVPTMLEQLSATAEYEKRKQAVAEFNAANRYRKRGIVKIPTKFGLSFATALHLNQAAAYVRVHEDGSVALSHGGTEMGQGLYTKMAQVAAEALGVPLGQVWTKDSQTDVVANPSPTAASSGSDLNGMAVQDACAHLHGRLRPYRDRYGDDAPMAVLAHAAYRDRVNLAANGFWKMPRIGYQWGNYRDPLPMYYITEVELDVLTGDHTVLRTDIMMDVGRSINPAIDYGQIEGAFVQGQGLFTMEESLWTREGELFTRGPGTYKIPGFSDIPQVFNVAMLRHDEAGRAISWKHLRSVQSSKGIGEPPLFLGSTVFFALREAVKAAREMNGVTEKLILDAPATAEKLRLGVGDDLVRRTAVVPKDGDSNYFVRIED
ncbi:xanthine dehydrogenase [Xylariomycetidae sp. FL0641]|nr:xanthine dehydrogenase [Xylariomycetidae sp. FL0641]